MSFLRREGPTERGSAVRASRQTSALPIVGSRVQNALTVAAQSRGRSAENEDNRSANAGHTESSMRRRAEEEAGHLEIGEELQQLRKKYTGPGA